MSLASGPTEELATAVLDHGLHLGGRHLLERMPDQPLCEGGLPADDVVEALPLEVVLVDGEAALDRVVLRRVRGVDDPGNAQRLQLLGDVPTPMEAGPVQE